MRGLASLAAQPEARLGSPFDTNWGMGVPQTVNEVSAFNLSAVWACETLIADAIATLPADTYRKTGTTREETSPPAWVTKPNPKTNRVDYETQRLLSLLGWGNAYSLLIRRGGSTDPMAPVLERWSLDPWRVECHTERYPGGVSETYYLVDGVRLPNAWIQHVPGYCLPGSSTGMSVIRHANQSLMVGTQSEAFAAKLYENGITAQIALEVPALPAEANDDVIEKLRDTVGQKYSGSANAYKPLVLTGGTTAKVLSINPTDAQFLETRKFQVSEIARWFRVPPHMIGDVEKSTSWGTGIEQQTLGFAKFTLQPWIVRLEQADSTLLTRPQYLKFNLDAFVRADLLTRYRSYAISRSGGWESANDIRAKEDEAPIPGGDVYLAPLNMADLQLFENDAPATPDAFGNQPQGA